MSLVLSFIQRTRVLLGLDPREPIDEIEVARVLDHCASAHGLSQVETREAIAHGLEFGQSTLEAIRLGKAMVLTIAKGAVPA